jgi:D-glycero-D-manno-heptose 1,7-bisphosphate phosphatase
MKAIFFDRDGTLMVDTGYCSNPEQVELLDGVAELLPAMKQAGFKLVIVTNQSGIGRGYFTEQEFWEVQEALERKIGAGVIDATYFCADPPAEATERRKPGPGMLLEAARDLAIQLDHSYMVGDKASDVEAGIRAGVKATILFARDPAEVDRACRPTTVARTFHEVAEFILRRP